MLLLMILLKELLGQLKVGSQIVSINIILNIIVLKPKQVHILGKQIITFKNNTIQPHIMSQKYQWTCCFLAVGMEMLLIILKFILNRQLLQLFKQDHFQPHHCSICLMIIAQIIFCNYFINIVMLYSNINNYILGNRNFLIIQSFFHLK